MLSSSVVIPSDGDPNTSIISNVSDDNTTNNNTEQHQQHQRLQCPCYKFTSLLQIEQLVGSDDETFAMIEWLNGSTDRVALQQNRILTCGKRSQCRFRYGTAFVVLQAIRDVCAPYLKENEISGGGGGAVPAAIKSKAPSTITSSSRPMAGSGRAIKDHPAMSNILVPPPSKHIHNNSQKEEKDGDTKHQQQPNILMGRKKTKAKAKISTTKRRVRPQLTTTDAVNIDPNWGKKESHTKTDNMIDPSSSMMRNDDGDNIRMAVVEGVGKTQEKNNDKLTVTTTDKSPSSSHHHNHHQSSAVAAAAAASPPPPITLFVTPTKGRIPGAPTSSSSSLSSPLKLFSTTTTPTTSKTAATATEYDEILVGGAGGGGAAPKENVERLAHIFVSLIENMLIPSTVAEIGGLFQLLSIRLSSGKNNNNLQLSSKPPPPPQKKMRFFSSIFSNADRCVEFAQIVLMRIQSIIQNLPLFIINLILQCGPLQENMPNGLRNSLLDAVDAHNSSSSSSFVSISVVEGNSTSDGYAIFTLPFEQDRDSRHNFTTQAEIALFKNREETRDAFLSLLRSFMTSKSRGFLPDHIEKSRQDAGRESKTVFSRILNDNIPWFGQFYVDLLLQLGMAPVQEMDQDVLQLAADKDKLQKLHRRLSSSSSSSKKPTGYRNNHNHHNNNHSTKPFHGHRKNIHNNATMNHTNVKGFHESNSATTPFHEALRHFHGYQEFFFVFVFSVDSHSFGRHLSRRMATMSLQLLSNQSAERGLEKRICDLQLLARFLGVLVFSSNWRGGNIDWNKIRPAATLDTLAQLESIGLSLPSLVQASWERASTLTFVPWVTDLLKLAKWDTFSLASRPVRQVLANLRHIQHLATINQDGILHGPSMEMVSFTLESLFNETVTLAKMTSLPQSNLSIGRQLEPQSLDSVHVSLNKKTVFVSSPHVETLFNTIADIGEARPKTTSHSPRKVRPSLIGASQIQVASILDSETGDVGPTASRDGNKRSTVQRRLLASFFHQHRDMKDICDFCLSTTIKAVNATVLKDFVTLSIQESESSKGPSGMENQPDILKASEKRLRDRLHSTIADGINLFKPPNSHPKVVDMAVRVTVNQGMEACMPRLRSLFDAESSIANNAKSNQNGQSDGQNDGTRMDKKTKIPPAIDNAFLNVIQCMKDTQKEFSYDDVASNTLLIFDAVKILETMDDTIGFPNENIIRSFIEAIFAFDRTVSRQAVSLLLNKGGDAAELFALYLQMASLIARHSKCAMNTLDRSLGESYTRLVALDLPQSLLEQIRQRIN